MGLTAAVLCGTAAASAVDPFYADVHKDDGSFFAVRPFYSKTTLEEGQIQDYFWPLYSRKSFKNERNSRAFIFYYTHQFDVQKETPRQRRWLLPVFFQGRSVTGEEYLALFPFGGTIREFLGRDELSFVLFPAYGKSRINEVETTSVLWPLYSRTRGDGIQRDRVFPIAGKSVLEGKYDKRFILWPFWTSADYFYPGDSGKSWILFPVCGYSDMDQERTLWLAPPFFRFTAGVKQDRIYCPWPFFQKIDSEWHDKFYLWPLWGEDQYKGGLNHRTFLFWPLLWSEKSEQAHLVKTRRLALPFFYHERNVLKEAGIPAEERATVSSYLKIWPLMSWQKENSASRFRMLELWPLKDTAPVERNWAPFWTLYQRTHRDGADRRDVLWFVWESEKKSAENCSECSLLKGLFSYKKQDDSKKFRFLYFFEVGE